MGRHAAIRTWVHGAVVSRIEVDPARVWHRSLSVRRVDVYPGRCPGNSGPTARDNDSDIAGPIGRFHL